MSAVEMRRKVLMAEVCRGREKETDRGKEMVG